VYDGPSLADALRYGKRQRVKLWRTDVKCVVLVGGSLTVWEFSFRTNVSGVNCDLRFLDQDEIKRWAGRGYEYRLYRHNAETYLTGIANGRWKRVLVIDGSKAA
jgi:hypothetical protein